MADRSRLFQYLPVLVGSLVVALWWSWSQRSRQQKGPPLEADEDEESKEQPQRERRWPRLTKEEKKAKSKAKREAKAEKLRAEAGDKMAELKSRFNALLSPGCNDRIVLAATDVEAWEKEPSRVTEIGLAFCVVSSRTEGRGYGITFRHRHLLIEEHLAMRNGHFVADNRDNFLYGDSEALSLADASTQVSAELGAADYIVGHAVAGDLKWLRSIGVGGISKCRPKKERANMGEEEEVVPLEERLVDTQVLAVARAVQAVRESNDKSATPDVKMRSLKTLSEEYGLDPAALHNGANDAAFTLQVMLSQCGIPFDPPPRKPSKHMEQPEFLKKQAAADAAAEAASGERDQERQIEVNALYDEVKAFAKALEDGTAVTDPESGMPEKRFPPTLSAFQRRTVHEAAVEHGLSSGSQGAGVDRFIALRAAGCPFPPSPRRKGKRRKDGTRAHGDTKRADGLPREAVAEEAAGAAGAAAGAAGAAAGAAGAESERLSGL
jgi:hypothetical protein